MSDVTAFKRDHYYKALREYGLPHHLAETIVDEFGHACEAMVVSAQINEQLRAENARLKAELAAIKARRCETCEYIVLTHEHFFCAYFDTHDIEPFDSCNHWTPKEAADADCP